jgi:hypothetical protein
MLGHWLTESYAVAGSAVRRKASIHAGSTGLTGLTGSVHAHVRGRKTNPVQPLKFLMRVITTMLTLLTVFKASLHASFAVSGRGAATDNPCNEVR